MDTDSFKPLFIQALERRKALFARLQRENTNAVRIFHGITEGVPGLTIDRYASLVLVQTFRDPLKSQEIELIRQVLSGTLQFPFSLAYNHRGKKATEAFDLWHQPDPETSKEVECSEFGTKFLVRARHFGIDPWLFLDLRAGRRFLRGACKGLSVLNLFSYTCSVGVSAAEAGASEVWNVDFSSSNLEVGRRNATLNNIPEKRFVTIEEDCLPIMRQLAGLPVGMRSSQRRKFKKVEKREFHLVVLDPPAWSKGPYGAVDVEGDYASLFKPAVLIARQNGGRILATNHVPGIELNGWIESLERCAAKAGRPLKSVQSILPDEDFPSFDGKPPLKMVIAEI
ncbi:MAG TPA: SAM-dependent methyltransferase [Bdellovibrionales bacterium]|nr:MAG: hypothetical protein A2Z97_15940 [Bdellovibrionales bacterium GWB1_52_6]OFZ02379.1 MAG: hypothetical protein A2X97_12565 [Bdellovibrionales bacterium GWA1_52_35]OFZ38718.1 MAG: hypothetical protein A2070_13550 [Bdellovibrionales bacterium GWC1_52_8]HAR42462.1 SAM-dependent methyltransferase [Bdellovibrionales bacterium]HCM41595.1 SAM-dependent methyltransferase [Bdellovibrionales bacterium]